MKEVKQNTQWHSAINSGIRIELEQYASDLQFEEEHKLGTGSKSIDLLIRKRVGAIIDKNIGRIFRGHNLFEVKGMTDYISINSFYQACGYGLFYKANTPLENTIAIDDITFSFVTKQMPHKLIRHLEEFWGLHCVQYEQGIYYLNESRIPIQFIISLALDPRDNLWLQSLLNPISSQSANRLLLDYQKHRGDCNYEDVMQQIVKQNQEIFSREENGMCQALDEIIEEAVQKRAEKRWEEGREKREKYWAEEEKKWKMSMEEKERKWEMRWTEEKKKEDKRWAEEKKKEDKRWAEEKKKEEKRWAEEKKKEEKRWAEEEKKQEKRWAEEEKKQEKRWAEKKKEEQKRWEEEKKKRLAVLENECKMRLEAEYEKRLKAEVQARLKELGADI